MYDDVAVVKSLQQICGGSAALLATAGALCTIPCLVPEALVNLFKLEQEEQDRPSFTPQNACVN